MGASSVLDVTVHIAQFLLQRCIDGVINRGALSEAAASFGYNKRTICKIWKETKEHLARGAPVQFYSNKKGKVHKDRKVVDTEKIMLLSVLERSSIRKMATKLEISKSLLGNWIKLKLIRPHTSAIKPVLSETNKLARLKFSLSQLRYDHPYSENIDFQTMHSIIHIDEEWFYMTKAVDRYYLLPNELEPYRACKSKRFITKVMFMCAVSRPHITCDGEILFDGKFGIFPFKTMVPAKRNSKNRSNGTLETKPMQAITKEVIKDMLINQVIPAIKFKWSSTASKRIFIQQDNAKPHISHNDPNFTAAANSNGFNITLVCQPPNSPDTNVNDLDFFRAIQSLQDDKLAMDMDDLLQNVTTSFEELSATTLSNIFLTLQGCYAEIMKVKGGNNYKIPHMNKTRLSRLGTLPESIQVDEMLVKECLEYLRQPENNCGSNYDIGPIMNLFGY